MSARTDWDILGGRYDLSNDFKSKTPQYLPSDGFGAFDLKRQRMSHGPRARAFDSELSPGAGPDDASVRDFDLAESIWSQDSDLTLDDLALESDTASSHSGSSRWSAAPSTPSTSRHVALQPAEGTLPAPVPAPLPVEAQAAAPVYEPEPEPDSPAPAYSRDPLEFDPALLASLDEQLRLHPFEAFEDVCWACFPDSPSAEPAHSFRSRSASPSRRPSVIHTSLTAHSSFSEASFATALAPPPPPAYPTSASKPLPNLPLPSGCSHSALGPNWRHPRRRS
ncbi:hypothetical protein BC834DRAFT_404018 [Gloeopeniophorella convolvens]|nr:hypothetical protein BC834DRAFT_404018 [Gloeopeniophorella convolvens]